MPLFGYLYIKFNLQVNEAVKQIDNTDKLEWMQSNVQCEGLQERLVFNSLTNTLGTRKLLFTGILHKVCLLASSSYFIYNLIIKSLIIVIERA